LLNNFKEQLFRGGLEIRNSSLLQIMGIHLILKLGYKTVEKYQSLMIKNLIELAVISRRYIDKETQIQIF